MLYIELSAQGYGSDHRYMVMTGAPTIQVRNDEERTKEYAIHEEYPIIIRWRNECLFALPLVFVRTSGVSM